MTPVTAGEGRNIRYLAERRNAVAVAVVHRLVPVAVRRIHNDVAGFVFAILGSIYGVLLAFVVIVVWEQFNEANQHAENEGSSAIVLFRSMSAYPDKQQGRCGVKK